MNIRTGDTVVVISGRDKGKTGQVLKVIPSKNRVVVADVNMRKRHVRGTPNRPGQIVEFEAALHMSNVMLLDPKSKKPTRVGFTTDKKGHKVRVAKKSGEVITKSAAAPKKTEEKATAAAKKDDKAPAKADKTQKTSRESKKQETGKDGKQPFWRSMGFGAEDMAEEESLKDAEVKAPSKDNSVPEKEHRQSERSHSRGK